MFGIAVSLGAGEALSSLMRSTLYGSVSIVSLLGVTALPFLITAFAVFLSPSALLIYCFGKAFLFSFAAFGLSRAFGSAGWIYCRLILFSDFCSLPLLYYLWLRLLGRRRIGIPERMILLALAVLTVGIDYRIVSSLGTSMIEIQKGLVG